MPAATHTRPNNAVGEGTSASANAPRTVALTGLSARKTVTLVALVWLSAHSQR